MPKKYENVFDSIYTESEKAKLIGKLLTQLEKSKSLLLRSKNDMKKFIKQSQPNKDLVLEIEQFLKT